MAYDFPANGSKDLPTIFSHATPNKFVNLYMFIHICMKSMLTLAKSSQLNRLVTAGCPYALVQALS